LTVTSVTTRDWFTACRTTPPTSRLNSTPVHSRWIQLPASSAPWRPWTGRPRPSTSSTSRPLTRDLRRPSPPLPSSPSTSSMSTMKLRSSKYSSDFHHFCRRDSVSAVLAVVFARRTRMLSYHRDERALRLRNSNTVTNCR